jgi:hypothetical protein
MGWRKDLYDLELGEVNADVWRDIQDFIEDVVIPEVKEEILDDIEYEIGEILKKRWGTINS